MAETQYDFPTEVLDLPSQGKVYPKEHPLSSGRITIKHMTAKEEDILSNQNLIKKGIVLDKLFESIIVGPEYLFKFYSSKLNESIDAKVDLGKVKTKEVDLSIFDNKNEFEFVLPSNKKKIICKLLTHGDEMAIDKDIQAIEKLGGVGAEITTRLRYMVQSVDGDNSSTTINKFVNGLLALDSRALRSYVKKISPDVDMKFIRFFMSKGNIPRTFL